MASSENRTRTAFGTEFHPVVRYLGGPFGLQKLAPAAEVILTHAHMDERIRGGELGLLIDRHVNPDTALPDGIPITRDCPGEDARRDGAYLSLAVRPPDPSCAPTGGELYDPEAADPPHAREWDFLVEHAAAALADAGVADDASDADKVAAFGDYAMRVKTPPVYGSFHPVDVLLHGSYCTGAANVQCALAVVSGIPARTIAISNHTMVEFFVEGRWRFCDNHVDAARYMHDVDYAEVTLNYDRYAQLTETQRSYISPRRTWARSPYHYSSVLQWHWAWGDGWGRGTRTDVMDGYGVSVPCDPHHAAALYPGRESYPFPAWGGTPEITLTEKGSWLRVNLRLADGGSLLKSFFVGPSEDNPVQAARVEWWFRGRVEAQDAVLLCGDGHEVSASAVVPGVGDVARLRFDLPCDLMSAPGMQDVVLVNRSRRTLSPVFYPTPLVEAPPAAADPDIRTHGSSLATEPIVF